MPSCGVKGKVVNRIADSKTTGFKIRKEKERCKQSGIVNYLCI
jgi:hypothetical protein